MTGKLINLRGQPHRALKSDRQFLNPRRPQTSEQTEGNASMALGDETNKSPYLTPVPTIVKPIAPPGFLKSLGPGLVTGAADDDPSGIATYSQVGAQFGYGLAWTMLFSFPLMAVIQAVSARIGCVTGFGIAQNLRRHYSPWLLRSVVLAS